jgi:hypothetical protein
MYGVRAPPLSAPFPDSPGSLAALGMVSWPLDTKLIDLYTFFDQEKLIE